MMMLLLSSVSASALSIGVPPVSEEVTYTYTTNAVSSGTSITLTKPANVSNGDLLVLMVFSDNTGSSNYVNTPTGWTLLGSWGNNSSDSHIAIFYRYADGSEGTTTDITTITELSLFGHYFRFVGAASENPFIVGNTTITGGTNTVTSSEITTTVDNSLVFSVMSFDGSDTGAITSSPEYTMITQDVSSSGPYGCTGAFATKTQVTAGNTGTCAFNWTETDGAQAIQFAVVPSSLSTPDLAGKTLVMLLIGQSNSIGRGTDLTSVDTTPVANIKMWSNTDTIIDAVEPIHHDGQEDSGEGGYGFAIARAMMTAHSPDQIVIVGAAKGGAGFIDGQWNPTTGGISPGAVYADARDRWNAAIAAIKSAYGPAVEIVVVWNQGEDEVQNESALFDAAGDANRYRTMAQSLFQIIRNEWDDMSDAVPFVVLPIPSTSNYQGYGGYSNIQADLAAIEDTMTRTAFFDISGISETFEDALHWDVATGRQFGMPFVSAWEAAYSNTDATPTTAVLMTPDPSNVSTALSLDARGLPDNAVVATFGDYPEFENKRVKVLSGALSFDGSAELRWRGTAGKPRLQDKNFSIKIGFTATDNISSKQGLIGDYAFSSTNNRSYYLRTYSNKIQFIGSTNGTSADILLESPISLNTYYEAEVRRVGTTLELIVGGSVVDTYTLSAGYFFYDTRIQDPFQIGEYDNGREFIGDITHVSLEFLS